MIQHDIPHNAACECKSVSLGGGQQGVTMAQARSSDGYTHTDGGPQRKPEFGDIKAQSPLHALITNTLLAQSAGFPD